MADNESEPQMVKVTKNPDGTVTTTQHPSPGVRAVARLLRDDYLSEYETDAPVTDWWPKAIEIVSAYLEAEGEA